MTIYKEGPKTKGYEFLNQDVYSTPQFINAVKKYSESGGGLEGTNYVFVAANGTDVENAAELQAAYNLALTKSVGPSVPVTISISSVFEVSSGQYEIYFSDMSQIYTYFPSTGVYPVIINGINYNMNYYSSMMGGLRVYLPAGLTFSTMIYNATQYLPITILAAPGNYNFENSTFTMSSNNVSLVSLDGNRSIIFNSSSPFGTLWVTGNNIYVKGVDVQTKALCVGTELNQTVIENCKGGDYSFGFGGNISGTFINCIGGNNSFASSATTTPPIGVLFNSFDASVSGNFINCEAGNQSFGQSFFGNALANGTFTNCKTGSFCFGSTVMGGTFRQANGVFKNCEVGNYCFANNGNCGGTFTNCTAGADSWITNNLTAFIYFSRQTGGQTIPTPSLSGGRLVAFISVNNQFIAEKP